MGTKNKQHHDRRMERIRQNKIKRRKKRAVIIVELLILSMVVYVAYEMNLNGRFQITDISNKGVEISEEIIEDTEG